MSPRTIVLAALLVANLPAADIHATAQAESLKSNVLGIKDLSTVDIGITNYSDHPITVTQAMIREWFPALRIEDPRRAKAVADKAFASSKKSRAIAAFNFASPIMVGVMSGGLIGFSATAALKAVAATSLANSTAQAFKQYLIGLQPNEADFLPNLPDAMVLAPFGAPLNSDGTASFSGVWTVLGSIDFTGSVNVLERRGPGPTTKAPKLRFEGDLPKPPVQHASLPSFPSTYFRTGEPAPCALSIQEPTCSSTDPAVCAGVVQRFHEMAEHLCDLPQTSEAVLPWISPKQLEAIMQPTK